MNISYNWLKEYVDFDLTPEEVSAALTSLGLETDGVEKVETIKGGLEGLVIGKVLTCTDHPDSDHLHITTVDLGDGTPVQIVCGAPNVAAGRSHYRHKALRRRQGIHDKEIENPRSGVIRYDLRRG